MGHVDGVNKDANDIIQHKPTPSGVGSIFGQFGFSTEDGESLAKEMAGIAKSSPTVGESSIGHRKKKKGRGQNSKKLGPPWVRRDL